MDKFLVSNNKLNYKPSYKNIIKSYKLKKNKFDLNKLNLLANKKLKKKKLIKSNLFIKKLKKNKPYNKFKFTNYKLKKKLFRKYKFIFKSFKIIKKKKIKILINLINFYKLLLKYNILKINNLLKLKNYNLNYIIKLKFEQKLILFKLKKLNKKYFLFNFFNLNKKLFIFNKLNNGLKYRNIDNLNLYFGRFYSKYIYKYMFKSAFLNIRNVYINQFKNTNILFKKKYRKKRLRIFFNSYFKMRKTWFFKIKLYYNIFNFLKLNKLIKILLPYKYNKLKFLLSEYNKSLKIYKIITGIKKKLLKNLKVKLTKEYIFYLKSYLKKLKVHKFSSEDIKLLKKYKYIVKYFFKNFYKNKKVYNKIFNTFTSIFNNLRNRKKFKSKYRLNLNHLSSDLTKKNIKIYLRKLIRFRNLKQSFKQKDLLNRKKVLFLYINRSKNNLFLTITKNNKEVLLKTSLGIVKIKNFKRILKYTYEEMGKIISLNLKNKYKKNRFKIIVVVNGYYSRLIKKLIWNFSSIRNYKVVGIRDYSPRIHNGCRLSKKRF